MAKSYDELKIIARMRKDLEKLDDAARTRVLEYLAGWQSDQRRASAPVPFPPEGV